jgi:hypothetical protein
MVELLLWQLITNFFNLSGEGTTAPKCLAAMSISGRSIYSAIKGYLCTAHLAH